MDLHSVTPTGEPSSNSRGQSSGEPALTNAEVLIVSITIIIAFLFAVQSFARWYTNDSDYSLFEVGLSALAALSQLSSHLKQNISNPQAVVPAAMDDLEAGEQVRFVEVQGSHWHSHSDDLFDDKVPTTLTNHDPQVPSRLLLRSTDFSAMEEQALSASPDAVPKAVRKSGAWERTLSPPIEEERHGMINARWTDSPAPPQPQQGQHHEIVHGNAIQEPGGGSDEDGASLPPKEQILVESTCCDMEYAAHSVFVKNFKEWFDADEVDVIDYSSYVSDIMTQKALDDFFAGNYDMPFNDHSD